MQCFESKLPCYLSSWNRLVGDMTNKSGEKKWRTFERLVASIERVLASHGAVVKSPDHLPDCDTGDLREVDASIRVSVGSTEIIAVVECRNRSRKQGVEWLEQLAAKKRSVGAHALIVVSSAGFCRRAASKAQKLGLELRCLSEVDSADLSEWILDLGEETTRLTGLSAKLLWGTYEPVEVSLHFEGAGELDPGVASALCRDYLAAPVLTIKGSGQITCLANLLKEYDPEFRLAGDPDGHWERKLDLSSESFLLKTTEGLRRVTGVDIRYRAHPRVDDLPLDFFQYGATTGPSRQIANSTWTAPNKDLSIRFTVVNDKGHLRVLVEEDRPA